MTPFTKSNLYDLRANLAFKHLLEILRREYEQVLDTDMSDPTPFVHGRGVGKRESLKTVFDLVDRVLEDIADNKGTQRI